MTIRFLRAAKDLLGQIEASSLKKNHFLLSGYVFKLKWVLALYFRKTILIIFPILIDNVYIGETELEILQDYDCDNFQLLIEEDQIYFCLKKLILEVYTIYTS